jgi:hypothetical protein
MSSTRTVAFLLLCGAVAFAGCKKKSGASGGDAEPAGSAAPADSSSAAASSPEAGGDDSAIVAVGNEAAAPDDAGAAPADAGTTPTVATGGAGFPGSYNCLGGLTLSQTGNGVTGNAASHGGMVTTTVEINCTARGNECVGTATRFTTKEGKAPKNGGAKKIVFKLANGGLEYTEGGVGGFCTRR